MFLSKILTHLCIITHCISNENIFVVIEQQTFVSKCHPNDCFKINGKQRIKMPKKVNANKLDSKIMREK